MSALVGIQLEPPSAVIYKAFKSGSAIDASEIANKVSLSAQENMDPTPSDSCLE